MKAKCDRLLPCGRCVRIGASKECSYNDASRPKHYTRPLETLANGAGVGHVSTGYEISSLSQSRLSTDTAETTKESDSFSNPERTSAKGPPATLLDLQTRIERLEGIVQGQLDKELSDGEPGSISSSFVVRLHPIKTPGTLNFKGSRSRYYGRTHWVTLFRQFDEVLTVMRDVMKDSIFPPQIREVQRLQKRAFSRRRKGANAEPCKEPANTVVKLLDILPTQIICEKLIGIYFNTWESTFCILHRQSFLDMLNSFWDLPRIDRIKLYWFLPQLVAILAVVCSNTSSLLDGLLPDSAWSNMACKTLNFWLSGLVRKDRNEISTLQTSCLLVLAMQLNMHPSDELWNATGSLVRSAMSMGLHIDPEPLDISILQKEIRRRLWATILELDLQASQAIGMSPLVHADIFSPEASASLTDSNLNVGNTPQPENLVNTFTDISPHHILASSLRLRLEIASLLGRAGLQEQDAQNLLRKRELIEQAMHDIPPMLGFEQSKNENERSKRLFAYALVHMSLLRSLFSVNLFLTSDPSKNTDESLQRNCLQCALMVLSTVDEVSSSRLNGHSTDSSNLDDIFLLLFGSDVYAAILTLSSEIQRLTIEGSKTMIGSHHSPTSNRRFLMLPKTTLIRTAEIAIENLSQRPDHAVAEIKNVSRLLFSLRIAMKSGILEDKARSCKEGLLKILDDYKRFFIKSGITVAEDYIESISPSCTGVSTEEQFMEGFDSNFDSIFFDCNFDYSTTNFFSLEA